jgi:hypothetical protein
MIAVMLDGVDRQAQRHLGAVDRAENLRKRHVEVAQPAVRCLLLIILLLKLRGQAVLPVPQLMRERALLRGQQQGCQHNLHQAAFQDHQKKPAVGDGHQINTTPGDFAKPRAVAAARRLILVDTAL